MTTLKQFENDLKSVPTITAWYLSELGEARGKQTLFTKQTPQRLKVLRQHALVESAISSNRIEGVTVNQSRIQAVVLGRAALHDRDEEEVRGYRNALRLIHEDHPQITEKIIKELHHLTRAGIGDAGHYKEKDSDIIEKYPDGRVRVRFKTVSAVKTVASIHQLLALWKESLKHRSIHPLIALAAFNLDFLCIHPFRDGNGRVSRLLLLLQLYLLGYEVGRYVSIERLIEQNKERYYETLEQSSQHWHDGTHDPWPYIHFILSILKTAYKEFEERAIRTREPKGAKTDLIEAAVQAAKGEFTLTDLEKACPSVSREMIRKVLRELKKTKAVECLGHGPGASWRKKGNTLKKR